jgi:ABC-type branched-subunit amino acid transport system substrate-binding protein
MTTHRKTSRIVLAILAALAMLAVACGDDGGNTSATTTTTTEAPPEDTPDETPDETPEEPEEPAEPEVVLTASATGVTAEAIKIGVPWVDVTAIGWEPSHDAEVIWGVAADTINAAGGVFGRNIELVMIGVDPTEPVAQDEACVRFTEDEEVFAVMGVIRNLIPLCYTEQHSTIVINTYITPPEVFERSVAPMIGILPLTERAIEAQLATLLESGYLDGAKIALSAQPNTLAWADTMKAIFEEAGLEVVSITSFEAPSSDVTAINGELDVSVERWRADGATAVVAVPGAAVPTTGALSRNGWDGLYVMTDATGTDVGLLDGVGYGSEALEGSVAIVAPDEADLYDADQAGVKECVDTFENAFDDDLPVELRPEDATTAVVGLVVRSCLALELFKQIAETAGVDLTNDSFEAGIDGLGDVTITGVLAGSLGPGKRDLVDAGAGIYTYDPETRRFSLS